MENKKPIVILENVTKIFNKRNWAVKKINLKIQRGTGIAVIGPNSSGKSVLARLVASLIKPTSGIVEYNFTRGDAYSSIGFQFFQTSWPEGFKVKEIVTLYKKIYDIQDEAWLEQLSNLFDINSRWDRILNTCGTSWLKLFSLYLALIHKPELVILDEVSNSIGLDMKLKIVDFLKEYKENYNATFILISPDEMLFQQICDRIIVLQSGLIATEDQIADLPEGTSLKDYVFEVLNAIAADEVQAKPDPIFRPILKKYEKKLEHFNQEYEKFIATKNLASTIDLSDSLIMLKNYHFHSEGVHQVLLKASTSPLDKKIIDEVRAEIKVFLKTFKKAKSLVKKEPIEFKFKKAELKALDRFASFNKYVKEELYPIFRSSKLIVDGNEVTAELSNKEMVRLKAMKKKYIQEEIRLMKLEDRIIKRQAKKQVSKN